MKKIASVSPRKSPDNAPILVLDGQLGKPEMKGDMGNKRRTETIIETHEVWVMRSVLSNRQVCVECSNEVEMLTPEEAAMLRSVSQMTIYRWVECGHIHFTETPDGKLFVCLAPLLAGTG